MYPFRYRFEFDHDEGINAIKAMLEIQGYPLYSETWSDQPPIFTMLLKLWFQIFGQTVLAGRVLVMLISAGLLWLVIQYLRQFFGNLHALIAAALLLLLPYYLRLSVSIMIGLPAIAFALLSFFGIAQWHRKSSSIWLLLSAAALGLSIMTKLFTAFLAPIFFTGIVLSSLISYREHKDVKR
ncbi:MAG: glycosyltransferase family 39 protein, partial [Anaerolineales bacterium]